MALIGSMPISPHKDTHGRYNACILMSWLLQTACVSISFFPLSYRMSSKQNSEGKMNTLHLFLNSAKSSQAGNRKEKSKVRGVIEPYFFCSCFINSQDLWPPSFQNATPFKSYIISPSSSHPLLHKSCHYGILPTWVLMSLLYHLTVDLGNHLWDGNQTWF